MSEIIAKKYIKAFVSSINDSELADASSALGAIAAAFSNQKFQDIIMSNSVKMADKESFVLSLLENPSAKLTNLIKLLAENGRLNEIPSMYKELEKQVAIKNNTYKGILISNFEVDSAQISDIEKNLSGKLGSSITLENQVTDYPGLKVEIADLGVEVGLSTARIKTQLAEHILKAL